MPGMHPGRQPCGGQNRLGVVGLDDGEDAGEVADSGLIIVRVAVVARTGGP